MQHKREIDLTYVQFLEGLSDKVLASAYQGQAEQALKYIKEFIYDGTLFETLSDFGKKTQECRQLKGNIMQASKNKTLDDFEKLTMALLVVLGEGFVLGVV